MAPQVNNATNRRLSSPVSPPTGTRHHHRLAGRSTNRHSQPGRRSHSPRRERLSPPLRFRQAHRLEHHTVTINYSGDATTTAPLSTNRFRSVSTRRTCFDHHGDHDRKHLANHQCHHHRHGHWSERPSGADRRHLLFIPRGSSDLPVTASGSPLLRALETSQPSPLTLNSQTLVQGANFITLQYTGDSNYNTSAYHLSTRHLQPALRLLDGSGDNHRSCNGRQLQHRHH